MDMQARRDNFIDGSMGSYRAAACRCPAAGEGSMGQLVIEGSCPGGKTGPGRLPLSAADPTSARWKLDGYSFDPFLLE